jgi:hypothetical protein
VRTIFGLDGTNNGTTQITIPGTVIVINPHLLSIEVIVNTPPNFTPTSLEKNCDN